MYTATIMFLAGLAIALGSDWTLFLVVPAALVLHFGVVKREERYLEAKSERVIARMCAEYRAIGCAGSRDRQCNPCGGVCEKRFTVSLQSNGLGVHSH
jgi:hypothetical protein